MHSGETLNLEYLPRPSFWNCAVIHCKDGQMWVMGGVVKKGDMYHSIHDVYIYDIKTNKWKDGPSLPEPLSHLGASAKKKGPRQFIAPKK